MNVLCYWYNVNDVFISGYAIIDKTDKPICEFLGKDAKKRCIQFAENNNIEYIEV